MPASKEWELTREAAQRYEDVLVRELLGPFARSLVEWAGIRAGEWVLDLGCGTGAAARFAAHKTGQYGRVVGLDSNPAMLEVARSLPPPEKPARPVEWQEGDVHSMALPSKVFDLALSAQSFQLVGDHARALKEIRRVLRPGGRLVLSVWCSLAETPYFNALTNAVSRHIGAEHTAVFRSWFSLSDPQKIEELLKTNGFRNILRAVNRQDFQFADLEAVIPRHIRATSMSPGLSAASSAARQAVVEAVKAELDPQIQAGGWMVFQSHFIRAWL